MVAPTGAQVLILGLTFKENCADIRNSKVVDTVHELEQFGLSVAVWDPLAHPEEAAQEYGLTLVTDWRTLDRIDAVVAAVAHQAVLEMPLAELAARCRAGAPFMDVKSAFCRDTLAACGFTVWRL